MKKLNSIVKTLFLCFILTGCLILLTGCTSLSYTGSDYDEKNNAIVQTNELFTFSTYKKTSEQENITMAAGVSKTPLPDVYVVYINIKNLSTSADYIFHLNDLTIKAGNETLGAIPPSAYLDAYQRYETGTYAGFSSIAPTLGSFANIQNNYQNVNNLTSTSVDVNKSANEMSGQIGAIATGISQHTISSASVIPAGKNEFFYIFLKDPKFLPIDIFYKNLTYSFGELKK